MEQSAETYRSFPLFYNQNPTMPDATDGQLTSQSDTHSDLAEKTLDSEQLVDGVLLNVFRDDVELPDGGTSVREWISHPGAAAVVPITDDGQTILIRQFRYPPRRTFLEVPAGKFDKEGEAPEDVAARELEEETGWKAGRLVHLGATYPCIGYSNEIIHFFVAHDLERGTQDLSEGEFVDVVTMGFEDAVAQARRGEILDMKTALALLMAASHLSEHPGT